MFTDGDRNCDCNCFCYFYLVLESFKRLLLLYYQINTSKVKTVQDAISLVDELPTYIQLSIKIYLHKLAELFRVRPRLFAVFTTKRKRASTTQKKRAFTI